jgi:hypothetical protein
MTYDKLKAGVFTGHEVCKVMSDPLFENPRNHIDK